MGRVRSFVIDHKQVAENKCQRGAMNKILPYRGVNNISDGLSPCPFFGTLEGAADTAARYDLGVAQCIQFHVRVRAQTRNAKLACVPLR